MDIGRRFIDELDAVSADGLGRPELLPVALTRAAAAVLPVHGAGLSVHAGTERSPLAASSELATTAEQLQFTAGQGPCLLASVSGREVCAPEELLARRWPAFHRLLVAKTPVRSVLALPLTGLLTGLGILDLYLTAPAGPDRTLLADARVVAELISGRLGRDADWSTSPLTGLPTWLDTPDARHRARVWTAVGMLTEVLRLQAPDALSLLRSHAHVTDRTVDQVTEDLLARRLPPEWLREDGAVDR